MLSPETVSGMRVQIVSEAGLPPCAPAVVIGRPEYCFTGAVSRNQIPWLRGMRR